MDKHECVTGGQAEEHDWWIRAWLGNIRIMSLVFFLVSCSLVVLVVSTDEVTLLTSITFV